MSEKVERVGILPFLYPFKLDKKEVEYKRFLEVAYYERISIFYNECLDVGAL